MEQTPVTLEELKSLLEDTLEATEENNTLLKAMRRDALIGGILKFVFWILIVAASFYVSAKFLEPYMGLMMNGQQEQTQDIGKLFKEYQNLLGQ